MKHYDCIIVGAGPSGLSAAINLYNSGIKNICVIDRFRFPRLKPCAGYLTDKTKDMYAELGVNIEDNYYKKIKGFKLFYRLKQRLHMKNKGLWTNRLIDRKELDYALYLKTKELGIKILENIEIANHKIKKNELTLKNKTLAYSNLIFADGTNGFSYRYQNKSKKKNIAMQVTFPAIKKESVEIHFGVTKKGYTWVSSTGKIINIGFTDVYKKDIDYPKLLVDFAKSIGYEINKNDIKSSFVPIKINSNVIMNDNVYFVGDAVGAADPMTLAGVGYALQTGKYVAESIIKNDNSIYLKEIKKYKRKFSYLYKFMHIFYLKSTLFFILRVGTHFFGTFISYVFDNMFVNNKISYKSLIKCIFLYPKNKKHYK